MGDSETTLDTMLLGLVLMFMGAVGIGLSLAFLKASEWIHVPDRMKAIYRQVRAKMHEAGWG